MVFASAAETTVSDGREINPISASKGLYERILEAAEKNSRMIEKFA